MRPYLLYNKRSYITARSMASKLGLYYHTSSDAIKAKGGIPIIRYGNSYGDFGNNDTRFNSPQVIKTCADSVRFSAWAMEHDIFTPIYKKFTGAGNLPQTPFLLRKRWHRAGKDIIIINSEEDARRIYRELGSKMFKDRYWVPVYKTDYEIRLHIVDKQVVRIFVKESTPEVNPNDFIRTSPRGWHYSLRTNLDEKYGKAQDTAIEIAEKLDLGFGGIDMAWVPDEERYIVWEVNTAPGLSENSQEAYAGILRQYV